MNDDPSAFKKPLKVLLIRFSSFGDVVQSLSLPERLFELGHGQQKVEIHWATKAEFVPLIETHPFVHKVWSLPKNANLKAVWRLCKTLRLERFDYIYDAHNSLRSRLMGWLVPAPHFLRKSQHRWKRFFLFQFRWNLYPKPFSGQRDLLLPLKSWGLEVLAPPAPQLFLPDDLRARVSKQISAKPEGFIALAPSAAFPLKRWPVEYWQQLVQSVDRSFVILGGPEDHFTKRIAEVAPDRVQNLAGLLTLAESSAVISQAKILVSNDTGLLHVAEQLGIPCVALMGPAPFGFPSRPKTRVLEMDLPCQPCSKHGQGPCVNSVYHFCLRGLSPKLVKKEIENILGPKVDSALAILSP